MKVRILFTILVTMLFFACDNSETDRGNEIDPSLCIASCYRLDDCFGLENFDFTINDCVESCDIVTESENECFDYCEAINSCDTWLDCFLDC